MEPAITSQPADHRNAARLGNFTSAHLGKFEPALTLGEALNARCGYLEVRCLGCDTHQTVALDIVRVRREVLDRTSDERDELPPSHGPHLRDDAHREKRA